MKFNESTIVIKRPVWVSKYVPHQGRAERQRRLRQISVGTLKGPVVSIEARYVAAGLVDPTAPFMLSNLGDY